MTNTLSLARSLSLAVVAALVVMTIAACDSTDSSDPSGESEFDRMELLENYGDAIILQAYETLEADVEALNASAQAFVDAPSEATLADVRNDLKAARMAWQNASLFQFGPAESLTLRSALNTYPTNEQQIDENIASGDYTLGSVADRPAGGFPALGYLLHGVGATDAEIIDAYASDANADGRSTYLLDNVAFIQQNVEQVVTEWSPSGGDYLGMFTSEANAGTDVGSSLGMLINAYVKHYERYLRDGKIGIPAGVRSAGVPRPTSTEAAHGGYSLDLALANLQATKRLYLGETPSGQDGTGLDDNLEALGAGELDTEIVTAIDEAISALEALSDPLADQIDSNNDPVLTAFQEMQDIVVLLKADMTSVLGITITFQDNDGD
jgi:hypothetical protein